MLDFYFNSVQEIKEAKRPALESYLEDGWAVDADSTWSLNELRDYSVRLFTEEDYRTNIQATWELYTLS
tara:strand:- start:14180 stop:14386 length:207 start_codon:yes stop_codon:yes gene_type:complete